MRRFKFPNSTGVFLENGKFIVFTGVLSSFKTGSIAPSLTGTWHYIDEYSHELKINFYENAEITIYIEGKRTNGKSECDEKHCSIRQELFLIAGYYTSILGLVYMV